MPKGKINIGSIFKAHREALNLTQEKVAEKLDVSQQQYQRYEAGTSIPPLNVLLRLMELLQVPHSKLFGDKSKDALDEVKDLEVLKIVKKNPELKSILKALDKNSFLLKTYSADEIILILKKISRLPAESKKNLLDLIDKLK